MGKHCYSILFGLSMMATPSISALETCKTLTATAPPISAPYAWQEGNKMVGALPDVLHTIAQELDITINVYYNGHWKRALTNVTLGHTDLLAGVYKNAERMEKYDYTIGVFDYPIVVATHKKNAHIYDGTWESLIGYKGIKPQGGSAGNKLDLFMKTHLSIKELPPTANMVRPLIRNSAQYVIATQSIIEKPARKAGIFDQIHISDKPLTVKPMHIVFSKKSPCKHLVESFNTVITSLKVQGRLTEIEQKNKKLSLDRAMNKTPTKTDINKTQEENIQEGK